MNKISKEQEVINAVINSSVSEWEQGLRNKHILYPTRIAGDIQIKNEFENIGLYFNGVQIGGVDIEDGKFIKGTMWDFAFYNKLEEIAKAYFNISNK